VEEWNSIIQGRSTSLIGLFQIHTKVSHEPVLSGKQDIKKKVKKKFKNKTNKKQDIFIIPAYDKL
jgi:hypothetical protein